MLDACRTLHPKGPLTSSCASLQKDAEASARIVFEKPAVSDPPDKILAAAGMPDLQETLQSLAVITVRQVTLTAEWLYRMKLY